MHVDAENFFEHSQIKKQNVSLLSNKQDPNAVIAASPDRLPKSMCVPKTILGILVSK